MKENAKDLNVIMVKLNFKMLILNIKIMKIKFLNSINLKIYLEKNDSFSWAKWCWKINNIKSDS